MPTFLNIIIYNENTDYERLMKKELECHLSRFKLTYYFVTYRESQDNFIMIENNCIYIKGSDGFVPQCLDKTIIALDYCINTLKITFDFFIRSNISTIINYDLFPELPLVNCYSSPIIFRLNWLDIPYGINENNSKQIMGTVYASGTSIIMSYDVCNYLLTNQDQLDKSIIDDVSIGLLLKNKYNIIGFKEPLWVENKIDNVFLIRNKSKNRYDDVSRMMKLNNYENQKNQSSFIVSANLGNDSNHLINHMIIYDDSSLFPYPNLTPRLKSKYFKMCTHSIHSSSFFIWSDTSIILKEGIIDWLINRLGGFDALFFKHSEEFINNPEQVKDYLDNGFDDQIGLIDCGLFIRRNKPNVNNAFNEWFIEQVKWSMQDQLSLPYILWKHQIQFKLIEDYKTLSIKTPLDI